MKNPRLFWFSVSALMLGGAILAWAFQTPSDGNDKGVRLFGVLATAGGAAGFAWFLVLAMIRSVISAARDARKD